LLVYYEPKFVELTGVIKTLVFPGPPNFESIKNGDADETGPYLILNSPIDIDLVPAIKSDNDEPEKNVKILQIAVANDNDWKKVKEGNYVTIIGNLYHSFNGHHHARVLFMIKKIKVLSKLNVINNKLDITKEDRQYMKHEYLQIDNYSVVNASGNI
jgi:hypothetical protein